MLDVARTVMISTRISVRMFARQSQAVRALYWLIISFASLIDHAVSFEML